MVMIARYCRRRLGLFLEPGDIVVECSEPEGHDGPHYDSAFGWEWREA